MYRKDYVLRVIEMIAEMVAGILGLIKLGKLEMAEEEIQKATLEVLDNDADKFLVLSGEDLIKQIKDDPDKNSDYLKMLSDISFAQAELFHTKREVAEAITMFEKSLKLIEAYNQESSVFSFSNQARQNTIMSRIAELEEKQEHNF